MAYEVQSQEHLDLQIASKTDKYDIMACLVKFLDDNDQDDERSREIHSPGTLTRGDEG